MCGKLIAIEGTDGSGKHTQVMRLSQHLYALGYSVRDVSFPNYGAPYCSLVEMYLHGEFGKNPEDVGPYVASTFFAEDRYASFKVDWGKNYVDGDIILSDRYTVSNAIHQGAKIFDMADRLKYISWLFDFEFNLLGLPKPDKVIYLQVPWAVTLTLLSKSQDKTKVAGDIHESNTAYLKACADNALAIAKHYDWDIIDCSDNGRLRSVEDIHKDVLTLVQTIL